MNPLPLQHTGVSGTAPRSGNRFRRFAVGTARALGSPIAFVISVFCIVMWALSGPFFHYSDSWQLIVNTATSIITFLMVFLIQNTQNRDAAAMQAKLDELLRAVGKARDQFIGVEHLTEREIEMIRRALEREVRSPNKKTGSAKGTVDRLLRRF